MHRVHVECTGEGVGTGSGRCGRGGAWGCVYSEGRPDSAAPSPVLWQVPQSAFVVRAILIRKRDSAAAEHVNIFATYTLIPIISVNCSDHIDYHANYEDIPSATINEFREVGVRWPYRCSRIRTPEVCTFQCFYCNVTLTFQVHVI